MLLTINHPRALVQQGDLIEDIRMCSRDSQPGIPEDELVYSHVHPEEDVFREDYCHSQTVQSGVVRLL